MSTQEVFVQQFARLFHNYRDALSPEAEQESTTLNAIPTDERRRLVAAARLAILELETNARMEDDSRRYFAKPGRGRVGMLSQILMTARLWAQQEPWAALLQGLGERLRRSGPSAKG